MYIADRLPGPSEAVWPMFEPLLKITSIFCFKLSLLVFCLLVTDVTPPRFFLRTVPGYEFQVSLVFVTVAAFAVSIVPLGGSAGLLVAGPVGLLTRGTFEGISDTIPSGWITELRSAHHNTNGSCSQSIVLLYHFPPRVSYRQSRHGPS